jgi:predicted DNA-binding transcriptional regulator YafY
MSRSERLLALLHVFRRHRRPVTSAHLAVELGVSVRTVYRDIQALCRQGASIEGEAGVGYILKPGFLLPPLMLTDDEVEALILGSRWVAQRTDQPLAKAAGDALVKIMAVLPAELRTGRDAPELLVAPDEGPEVEGVDLTVLRKAIRAEYKVKIAYRGASGVLLAFFDRARVLAAWCELREDFRHFRTDRIDGVEFTGIRYPTRRHALLKQWRAAEGIPQN